MRISRHDLLAALAVLALGLAAPGAGAQDLTILSGGAVKAGLTDTVPAYEKATGRKVTIDYAPVGALMKKLAEGATPDIVMITTDVLAEAEKRGFIVPGSVKEVGRVGVGIAVHEKAPLPDISTADAVKRTLLAARSIVYINPATGTSGRHFAQVLQNLGIADAMKPKTTLLEGGYVVEAVGRGEIELGIHQITEILPVKGIKLVGPLPEALQKVTVYIGALTPKARDPEQARRFLAHLQTPESRQAFAKRGYMAGP